MNVKDINELNDAELEQFILTKSGAKAFQIETGEDLTTDVKVASTNLKRDRHLHSNDTNWRINERDCDSGHG